MVSAPNGSYSLAAPATEHDLLAIEVEPVGTEHRVSADHVDGLRRALEHRGERLSLERRDVHQARAGAHARAHLPRDFDGRRDRHREDDEIVRRGDLLGGAALFEAGRLDFVSGGAEHLGHEGAHALGATDDADGEALDAPLEEAALIETRRREERCEDVADDVFREPSLRRLREQHVEERALAFAVE